MNEKETKIVKSILGDDFFIELEKSEIFKPNTKTVVSPEEIKVALQIVPRTILSYLFSNLKYRDTGDIIDLELPFVPGAAIHINKLGPDNYKGEVIKEGKVLVEFQHRSLPSIGLILLTTFELYDLSLLDEIKEPPKKEVCEKVEKLQDLIDERMMLHHLIKDVVDRRISERDAIHKLIQEKLNSHIMSVNTEPEQGEALMTNKEAESMDKKSKLREFLENKEQRRQEEVEIDKSEIRCQDCLTPLYKAGDKDEIKLCVCYGQFHNKTIEFSKSQDNRVKFKFPKSFDTDNVEMLLDTIKEK